MKLITNRIGILNCHIAFDNGLLRNIFAKSKNRAYETFWSDLARYNYFLLKEPVFFYTPFMLFEFLGYRMTDYDFYDKNRSLQKDH